MGSLCHSSKKPMHTSTQRTPIKATSTLIQVAVQPNPENSEERSYGLSM